MGFFSKLLGKSDWKKTLIRDLVTLTAVDGDMDKEEVALAFKIATSDLGFTEQKFVDLMNNLSEVEDVYPTETEDKLEYLQYLLQMTYADGYVDDNEIAYMKLIAKRMNFHTDTIDKVIAHVENSTGESYSDVKVVGIDDLVKSSKAFKDEQKKKSDDLTVELKEKREVMLQNKDTYSDESSINKIIITPCFDTVPEVQTMDGYQNYLTRTSRLSRFDLHIELSNVLAAKHNLITTWYNNNDSKKQEKLTDLTDKVVTICINVFGQGIIMNYANRDIRKFNDLVNEIDSEIAQLELAPSAHGKKILEKLHERLNS